MLSTEVWKARVAVERERRRRMNAVPALWSPYPNSPQERARDSSADVIGFGGQAGGGKAICCLG